MDLHAIAPHGVDLSVVGQIAEGLGKPPCRMGIRGVSLVERGEREGRSVGEVRVEGRQAIAGNQALVHDGPARSRGDGEVAEVLRRRQACDPPPNEEQAALKSCISDRPPGPTGRPSHEDLGKRRASRPCGGSEHRRIARHCPPRGGHQVDLFEGGVDDGGRSHARPTAPRQEELEHARPSADPVTARQPTGQAVDEPALQWKRDPGAIRRRSVRPEGATMSERGKPGQGQGQDPVTRSPTGVGDEPDAAGVMFGRGVVERRRDGGPARHERGLP